MKLLIAEDDLSSRTMLAAVSRNWGFEPIVVENGEAEDPPRLMLLDWMMPELDDLSCVGAYECKKRLTLPTLSC